MKGDHFGHLLDHFFLDQTVTKLVLNIMLVSANINSKWDVLNLPTFFLGQIEQCGPFAHFLRETKKMSKLSTLVNLYGAN